MKREIRVPKNTKETKTKNSVAISQLFLWFFIGIFFICSALFMAPRLRINNPGSLGLVVFGGCLILILCAFGFIKLFTKRPSKKNPNETETNKKAKYGDINLKAYTLSPNTNFYDLERPLNSDELLQNYSPIPLTNREKLNPIILESDCEEDAYELYLTVQKYTKEFAEKYKKIQITQPVSSATLENNYCMNLECKRLERLGLQKRYVQFANEYGNKQVIRIEHEIYGHYKLSRVKETTRKEICYSRANGSEVKRYEEKTPVQYHILRPKSFYARQYICPNCLDIQSLDSVESGCTNCQTKVNPSEIDFKVIRHEEKLSLGKLEPTSHNISYEKHNPEYSRDEFFSSIANKIKALHYANNSEEIASWAKFDTSDILKQCADIFDVTLTHYNDFKVSAGLDSQEATVSQQVSFLRYDGQNAIECSHIMDITLRKGLKYSVKNDYRFSFCPHCNKEFSWYSSMICPHCKQPAPYEEYDWVVTNATIRPVNGK